MHVMFNDCQSHNCGNGHAVCLPVISIMIPMATMVMMIIKHEMTSLSMSFATLDILVIIAVVNMVIMVVMAITAVMATLAVMDMV